MTTPMNDPALTRRDVNDPAELDRFLDAYTPSTSAPELWQALAAEAIPLVKRAGPYTRGRVEKDIQTLGAVVAHVVERGRPVSLDEVLADATLLDFDLALARAQKSGKYRENRRGILRRLQAAHHGVPWRRPRRGDGERVTDLPPPTLATQLAAVLDAAEQDTNEDATALRAAVDLARRARHGDSDARVTADAVTWRRARACAERHGMRLTVATLAAAVTHEMLLAARPLAVLAKTARLTRRDLDLGLAHAASLPATPSAGHRAALRGVALAPVRS